MDPSAGYSSTRVGIASDQFCKTDLVPPTPILLSDVGFTHQSLLV